LMLPRQALHAARLLVRHPTTSEPLEVLSPLPRDLAGFIATVTIQA